MDKIFSSAKELKEGKYILIDDVPCRVVQIETSKPGKHGAAKMRVTAIGVFNDQKKTWLGPSDQDVEVPIIDRGNAQIVSLSGKVATLMDSATFETYELTIPDELLEAAQPGKQAEIMVAMGKRAMIRIK